MGDAWEARRWGESPRAGDVRSEFERDYARLIHSSAFRRLQSKTQVLGLGESDFYRTRLTHSMEVAQIGVGIVRWLKERHKSEEEILSALPRSSLMSSICLAHDIGHPPFGHGGEVALNVCMRDYGGFEGNGQTLRILSRLDKYTNGFGMNPTRRLLLGILKYPATYNETVRPESYGDIPAQRWLSKAKEQKPPKCYLDGELDVVGWILDPLSSDEREEFVTTKEDFDKETGKKKHKKPKYKSLDTTVMELADDISYSLHDLEDAISLGMIMQKDWDSHNDGKEAIFYACNESSQSIAENLFSEESFRRKQAIGGLVHKFIGSTEVKRSEVLAASTDLIMWSACMDEAHEKLRKHIFDLVNTKVIRSPNVQQLEFKGQKLVMELFDAISSDPERLLPKNALKRYEGECDGNEKMRHICDFIAGMTDEYATRLYEKLYYPHKGSIFDRL